MWAISVVLRSDSAKMLNPGVSYISWTYSSEEEVPEDNLASKLLRWLAAAVIHAKLSRRSSAEDAKFSKRPCFESSLSFVQYATETGKCKSESRSEEMLASSLYYLQQLTGIHCRCLPSVVSALCLLLPEFANVSGNLYLLIWRWDKIRQCKFLLFSYRSKSLSLIFLHKVCNFPACSTKL